MSIIERLPPSILAASISEARSDVSILAEVDALLTVGKSAGFPEIVEEWSALLGCDRVKLTGALSVAFLLGWHCRGSIESNEMFERLVKK